MPKISKKNLDRVFLLYQSIAFLMVEMRGIEPRYIARFTKLSTCLAYPENFIKCIANKQTII